MMQKLIWLIFVVTTFGSCTDTLATVNTTQQNTTKNNTDVTASGINGPVRFQLAMFVSIVIFIPVTVLGNGLVIIVIFMTPSLRAQPTYIYLASLAISDVLIGTLLMPLKAKVSWDNGSFLMQTSSCWFYILIDIALSVCSVMHLFVIALDRYASLRYSFQYRMTMTTSRVLVIVLVTWLFSIVVSLFGIVKWDTNRRLSIKHHGQRTCGIDNREYFTTLYVCCYILPIFIMSYTYFQVYKTALHHIKEITKLEVHESKKIKEKHRRQKEFRSLRAVVIVLIAFIFCWIPTILFTFALFYGDKDYWKRSFPKLWFQSVYFVLVMFLPPFNSTLNPFIYVIANRSFRVYCRMVTNRFKFLRRDVDSSKEVFVKTKSINLSTSNIITDFSNSPKVHPENRLNVTTTYRHGNRQSFCKNDNSADAITVC